VNKLPRKFDIKEEYNRVVEKLSTKMDNTKNPKEKIAIRYIMRQVNKAYTDYIDAISIDEETRRTNMKNINMKMAA
jgi:DNA-binding IscR family transcriptional regulator